MEVEILGKLNLVTFPCFHRISFVLMVLSLLPASESFSSLVVEPMACGYISDGTNGSGCCSTRYTELTV